MSMQKDIKELGVSISTRLQRRGVSNESAIIELLSKSVTKNTVFFY